MSEHPVELKISSSMLTFIFIRCSDEAKWRPVLEEKLAGLPDDFKYKTPFVLDFSACTNIAAMQIYHIQAWLKEQHVDVVGINDSDNLPSGVHSYIFKAKKIEQKEQVSDSSAPAQEQTQALREENAQQFIPDVTVREAIRSGQQKYSPGHLTIIGNVSAGAELIADGNIYVFGSLRGRAYAGNQGNVRAIIYCYEFDAEFVSIGGQYQLREQMEQHSKQKNMLIYIMNDKMIYEPLSPKR